MTKRFLTVFDLDHTLLKANSSYAFGRYLYKHNFFSSWDMIYVVSCYALHKRGALSLRNVHEKIFARIFMGRSLASIKEKVRTFLDAHFQELVYQPALDRLQQAARAGHIILILSSSPSFLVAPIADRFNISRWESSEYAVDKKGEFALISRLIQGEDKAHIVSALSFELDIPREHILAYSDSILDLPLLESAHTAVGVSPDKKLLRICKERCWEVI